MTLPLHYWPVSSGDHSLLSSAIHLIVACLPFGNSYRWQMISLRGLCGFFFWLWSFFLLIHRLQNFMCSTGV
jgi:hypothetical protein